MIIHSATGWHEDGSGKRRRTPGCGRDDKTGRDESGDTFRRHENRPEKEDRQLRRMHRRIAHLAALMKLRSVMGGGAVNGGSKFPPDGNLSVRVDPHGGKNENEKTDPGS